MFPVYIPYLLHTVDKSLLLQGKNFYKLVTTRADTSHEVSALLFSFNPNGY